MRAFGRPVGPGSRNRRLMCSATTRSSPGKGGTKKGHEAHGLKGQCKGHGSHGSTDHDCNQLRPCNIRESHSQYRQKAMSGIHSRGMRFDHTEQPIQCPKARTHCLGLDTNWLEMGIQEETPSRWCHAIQSASCDQRIQARRLGGSMHQSASWLHSDTGIAAAGATVLLQG